MHSNMRPKLNAEFHLVLSEEEARALANITGWSSEALADALLSVGGDNKKAMRPAFISLFNSTAGLRQQIELFDKAHGVLIGTHEAKRIEPGRPQTNGGNNG